ncbi:MAG: dephospho-CoA kinase [Pseudomonadota bacterium]
MGKRFCVGVTGGIGSGKSALTNLLAEKGIQIVDADIAAREVVALGSSALEEIRGRYGAEILLPDGNLNRKKLREIVFENPEERVWLETLTHPLIGKRIAEQLEAAKPPYVVLSSPLLLEGSQSSFTDHVVVVDVPESLQIERTMRRDDNSEELVRAVMWAQLSREERLARADSVVDNSGTLEALENEADALHTRLVGLAETL